MNHALRWMVRRVGGTTLLIGTLFGVVLLSMAWLLSVVVRGLDLSLLLTMTCAGACIGWMLARSRMQPLLALPVIILLAVLIVFARVGQLGDELIAFCIALVKFVWRAQLGQFDTQALTLTFASLQNGAFVLAMRAAEWARALLNAQPLYEPVASALVWSFVVCVGAAWSAWQLRRSARAFAALLPLVILLALVLAYSGRDVWLLFVVLSAWFGLMVVVPFRARMQRWEQEKIGYADDLGFDLAMVTVPAILIIVTLALSMPAFSPREIERWAREWNASRPATSQVISNSFGIEHAPEPRTETFLDIVSSPGMPRSHLVGASPELLNTWVMTIETDATDDLRARYWLGTTYDEYTGQGWYSSGFKIQEYDGAERVSDAVLPDARVLHQTVRAENVSGIVYAAGNLSSVDKDFQIAWRQPDDMFGAQVNAKAYRAESFVQNVNADALRAAGQDYPAWIRSQYLFVPDSVPPRVIALARDLTANALTPYDRAVALEAYLRTIPYALDVPAPPAERDVTDYFLFELKRGYCDYYATAMAILARAAGLPARIAVGYAAGEYDEATRTYRVVQANAHSWTQIYFPGYGWIDFEPTRGRDPIARNVPITRAPVTPDVHASNANEPGAFASSAPAALWFWVLGICACVVLTGLGALLADSIYLRRAARGNIERVLYARVVWCAQRAGLSQMRAETPQEINAQLQAHFAAQKNARVLMWLWRPLPRALDEWVACYVETTYGAHDLSASQAAEEIRKWEAVRVRVGLALWLNFAQRQFARTRFARGAAAR